jgi:hypothetical protein
MFAKLRMSVEEASQEFFTITEEVYKPAVLTPLGRTQKLKECMEHLMEKKGLSIDLELEGTQAGGCAR